MTKFIDNFSKEVWDQNYNFRTDGDIDGTFRRVAKAIASVEETEEKRQEWEEKFFDLLSDFKGVPGGRILSNAGTDYYATSLLNCYTSPRNGKDIDSLGMILEDVKNQAFTLKSEGGWGQNFSWIRPRGSFIHGIGVESPGAVKYMELYDKVSEIITSGSGKANGDKKEKGKKKIRKGAQIGVISCFSKNTNILTDKGWINVVDVVEMLLNGLEVQIKGDDGNFYSALNPVVNNPSQLYSVELEDGTLIETTEDHKFVVKNIETDEEYLKPLKDINIDIEYIQTISE